MPTTIRISSVTPRAWADDQITKSSELFSGSCGKETLKSKGLIQSSFSDDYLSTHHVSSTKNGLVNAIYCAWSQHHHLVLRPEDIWFAILSQLSFYINANAEEVRSFFVKHKGKEQLTIFTAGTIGTVDWGELAMQFTSLMEKFLVDPELRDWVMPNFSTTTDTDRVAAAILMMGAMQKYFEYGCCLMCGLPSVTLLGERSDYVKLLERLDKIPQLGTEPAAFCSLLRPIITRFITCFDHPTDPNVVDFWRHCADRSGGSGPTYISGWVTAFCFWDEQGQRLGSKEEAEEEFGECLSLDGIDYCGVELDKVPAGYASVPVAANDNGTEHNTRMLAGSVGIEASTSIHLHTPDTTQLVEQNTIKPVIGWWMYETLSDAERGAKRASLDKELAEKKAEHEKLGDLEELRRKLNRAYDLTYEIESLEQKISQKCEA
ncbi:hypothetical protein MMC10_010758 [Thelotrema lepadinum]|nr:hypothetical protein [Thelotrema lepadinum]